MIEIRLLGQFNLRVDGKPVEIPSRPAQSVLAYLALTAGIAHDLLVRSSRRSA